MRDSAGVPEACRSAEMSAVNARLELASDNDQLSRNGNIQDRDSDGCGGR